MPAAPDSRRPRTDSAARAAAAAPTGPGDATDPPHDPAPEPTDRERRGIRIEIAVVLVVTFGLQGVSAVLSLLNSALSPEGVRGRTVALNASRAEHSLVDLLYQLVGVARLAGWAALGLYLLWRSGIGPRLVGLARPRLRADLPPGLVLAAVIGLPGLGLYLIAHALGVSVTIVPSAIDDHWWRLPVLVLSACANSVAEEVLVVGWLLTRLRALGWSPNSALLASALLRGSYHLYQGIGGGLGNVVMGLIFGRYWQRTNKLWPLVIAHALIDAVAYLGYVALRGRVGWLP
ncbi:CPBP family intramembrane glutamic endopeptidase [Nocardia farcinica]|uniref:CPBP family intramembrane glutamic endopeptidase n=1 Tax=Nocardia farcinica TaxID=37329 RepID=UPI00245848AF|nr:CPBP family intramembrane metalloprotease [Nocardia farcinica]